MSAFSSRDCEVELELLAFFGSEINRLNIYIYNNIKKRRVCDETYFVFDNERLENRQTVIDPRSTSFLHQRLVGLCVTNGNKFD